MLTPLLAAHAPVSANGMSDGAEAGLAMAAAGGGIAGIVQVLVLLGAAGVVAYAVIYARSKFSEIREKEAMAEALMAAELARLEHQAGDATIQVAGAQDSIFGSSGETPILDVLPQTEEIASTRLPDPLAPAPAPQSMAEPLSCEPLLTRLRHAGMLQDVESYHELNGIRNAAATVILRGGKRALVVCYFESEPFVQRNLKRHDLVIMSGPDGRAVVVNQLDTMLADWVAGQFL